MEREEKGVNANAMETHVKHHVIHHDALYGTLLKIKPEQGMKNQGICRVLFHCILQNVTRPVQSKSLLYLCSGAGLYMFNSHPNSGYPTDYF